MGHMFLRRSGLIYDHVPPLPAIDTEFFDAPQRPSGAARTVADDLPPEPGYGSAVRDQHGGVWAYSKIGWWMCGATGPTPWAVLAKRGPLHLLVDGPVIT